MASTSSSSKTSSIFDLEEFKQYRDMFMARKSHFEEMWEYYKGTIYDDSSFRLAHKLYAGTKALFLPLSRTVDLDEALIPGGWQLAENTPAEVIAPLITLFDWSNWKRKSGLFIKYGASMGNVVLRVVDLREQKKVVIVPEDPRETLVLSAGEYDDTPVMALTVTHTYIAGGLKEYAEVITAGTIRTFLNGSPMGFDERDPEYPNVLGFVPFVDVENLDEGDIWGAPTFDKVMPLLDAVNELASYLADMIGKHAEPQWAISGAEAGELTKGDNVWFLPDGASVQAILASVDISGVLAFITEVKQGLMESLPEMAFDELRKKDQIATASIELQLAELIAKVKKLRLNYEHGLNQAIQYAGLVGAGMEGVGTLMAPLQAGVEFDPDRPVLPQLPRDILELELLEAQVETAKMATGVSMGPEATESVM